MKYFTFILFYAIVCTSCSDNKISDAKRNGEVKNYVQVNFKVNLNTPTVDINSYTLITSDVKRDSSDARAIIRAKVILPLAMQKHDAVLFDSVLAEDFISQGEGEFFNREEYIQDRVNGKWTIWDVKYENLVLEFFGDIAVLTYRNIVKEKDEFGKQNTFHWFWTDIWIMENGKWKIKVLRAIN
jgi:Domain of unknown function (DUF4440)